MQKINIRKENDGVPNTRVFCTFSLFQWNYAQLWKLATCVRHWSALFHSGPEVSFPLPGSSTELFLLLEGLMKMAASRRSSQQQQSNLSSPPRTSTHTLTPPGSSPVSGGSAASPVPAPEQESVVDPETTPVSPDLPAPALSSSSSTSSSTAGGSSSGSSPDSGSTSPGGGGCGTSGAFRELFEACRNGDVSRVKRLVDTVNVNAKDMAGRKSTPLHFAAGNLS